MNKITKAVFMLAAAGIAGEEGLRLSAYRDAAGVPTICNGITAGVRMGDTATPAYCQNALIRELIKHSKPYEQLPYQVPVNVQIAGLSLTYNIGIGNTLKSGFYADLKKGDWKNACTKIVAWRKVRIDGVLRDCSLWPWSQKCGGVYNRRVRETQLCDGTITIEEWIESTGGHLPSPDGAAS